MPSFNRGYYIIKAIQYILESSYVNWEVVIADDGSHNPITKQALNLFEQNKKIRVFYLHTNSGNIFAYNFAISQMRGQFMAILDDDDVIMPWRLSQAIDEFHQNPQAEVLFSPFLGVNIAGIPYKWYSGQKKNQ